jgi:hypothetical protein
MAHNDNQHVQAIPSTVLAAAQAKIDEVLTSLAPYLLALTPGERRELPKMGEKTIGFVEKPLILRGKIRISFRRTFRRMNLVLTSG